MPQAPLILSTFPPLLATISDEDLLKLIAFAHQEFGAILEEFGAKSEAPTLQLRGHEIRAVEFIDE